LGFQSGYADAGQRLTPFSFKPAAFDHGLVGVTLDPQGERDENRQDRIPGADQETFEKLAAGAKANCPVSKLLNAEITLDAALVD
jgi:hypothetical protein